jgi:hypothetical protein
MDSSDSKSIRNSVDIASGFRCYMELLVPFQYPWFAGQSTDAKLLIKIGNECLPAKDQADCAKKTNSKTLGHDAEFCVWDKAQEDGRRCQPQVELGPIMHLQEFCYRQGQSEGQPKATATCDSLAGCTLTQGDPQECYLDASTSENQALQDAYANAPSEGRVRVLPPSPSSTTAGASSAGAATTRVALFATATLMFFSVHGVSDHDVEKNIQRAKSYTVYEQAKEATRAYGEAYHTRFLYTCAVPVSVQCANAHLPAFGQDFSSAPIVLPQNRACWS